MSCAHRPGGSLPNEPDEPASQLIGSTASSTWNFQAWYREPAAGGPFFDLSDALNLVFVL
jgi:hypothetical protein